jgi:outer membrane lipoprotein SlyB
LGIDQGGRKEASEMKLLIWVGFIFSVVVALGLTGCSSRTPNIYKMNPGNLERIRSSIGRVGVTISSYPVERDLKKPAKGITGGMARGFVVGASAPIVIGAVAPVPGGTFIGLLLAPFTAVAGGVYGATKGVPPEDIEEAQTALDQAIDRLKKMNLRQTFINEVVVLGEKRTNLEFVELPESGPKDPKEVVRYDQMKFQDIDNVLELRIEEAGLLAPYSFNPPSKAFIKVLVRLSRAEDNEILIDEALFCVSEIERKYIDWAQNAGQFFVDEFVACIPEIADKIVDDFFLVYPIKTR